MKTLRLIMPAALALRVGAVERCLGMVRGSHGSGLLRLALMAGLLTGCKGIATPSEKAARAQLAAVGETYRPAQQRPLLPILTTNSTLSDFLKFAMLNQPSVEAAYDEWAASVERITTARSLPDPQITFQMDIQDIITSIMPGLMMNFPAPGKLRAGAAVASAESQSRYFAFQSSVLASALAVKRAYYQLFFLEEKIRVNRETLSLLSDLEQLARAQHQVGKVTLQDVLRAQIEQDRLGTETGNLDDSRTLLFAQFKAALGLRPEEAMPPVPRQFESTSLDVKAEQLLQTALTNSTRLQGIRAEVRAAEAAIALAYRARLPDSSLGLMADAKMGPVLYRPLGTISLPIWRDKLAAQIAETQANKRAVEARLTSEQIALAVVIAEKSFLYREASRNVALLQGKLMPKQQQSLEVARSGYLAGQIDFFNLTDAEQTLLRFRLDEVEARTQRELSLAELALILEGMPPSDVPMATSGARSGASAAAPTSKGNAGSMNRMK